MPGERFNSAMFANIEAICGSSWGDDGYEDNPGGKTDKQATQSKPKPKPPTK
jgi:hypothetical protein